MEGIVEVGDGLKKHEAISPKNFKIVIPAKAGTQVADRKCTCDWIASVELGSRLSPG
jgi:hypothetical protein